MATGFRGLDPTPSMPPGVPPGLIQFFSQVIGYLGLVREVVNNLLIGKLNATLDVTLTANAATTTVADPRIGGSSSIQLMALSANASAEVGNGTVWWGTPGNQTVVLNHANAASTDRNFRLTIIG